jgi:hypothetical protein
MQHITFKDEIHLTLPRFSPVGRYAVAVLQSKSQSAAVALGSANATGTKQRATFIVIHDLSEPRPEGIMGERD